MDSENGSQQKTLPIPISHLQAAAQMARGQGSFKWDAFARTSRERTLLSAAAATREPQNRTQYATTCASGLTVCPHPCALAPERRVEQPKGDGTAKGCDGSQAPSHLNQC